MTYREQEQMTDIIVNQVIFTNSLGEVEYHPERLDMLFGYFYMKYFKGYKFDMDYVFSFDIESIKYYEEIKSVITNRKIAPEDISEWGNIKNAIMDKIEFEKQRYFK